MQLIHMVYLLIIMKWYDYLLGFYIFHISGRIRKNWEFWLIWKKGEVIYWYQCILRLTIDVSTAMHWIGFFYGAK